MRAADPVPATFDIADVYEGDDWWDYQPGGDPWPFEPKVADWGIYCGRVVGVDYAAPAL
jgi:hypothetical protein